MLIDVINDHGFEQLVQFPTREKNTLDLILTSLPGQFHEIHSPDKLSDHDVISRTLKFIYPQKRNLGERSICTKREILTQQGKMPLTLQKTGTSMGTQTIVRFRKTST